MPTTFQITYLDTQALVAFGDEKFFISKILAEAIDKMQKELNSTHSTILQAWILIKKLEAKVTGIQPC